ncbi:hypothetical protein A6C57_01020 [Fibrella sp. ES10-3-2-2]|nr:hypothetical protein A6C57_01020 [Fibrella sp. ES10-3-2-2]
MLRARYAQQEVLFPTQWPEVTLAQFQALEPGTSLLLTLASDPDQLLQLPDAALDDAVLPHLRFITDVPDFALLPVPDQFAVTLGEETRLISRPTDLGLATYGQKKTVQEELRRLLKADRYNYIDAALPLLGVYLYPELSGKPFVDIIDTKPYEPAILALPCTVALPLAAFFLRNYNALTHSGRVTYELVPEVVTTKRPWWRQPGQWFRSWRSTRPTSRPTTSPRTAA